MRPSFEIGLLIVGIFLSIWWVRYIILPFLYSFYWTLRRWVKWYTSLRYLVGAVISVMVVLYLPKVAAYPPQSRFFGFGLVMGIVISFVRMFDKSARLAMRDDFAHYMKLRLTPAGVAALKSITPEPQMEETIIDEDRAISRQVWNDCWRSIILHGAVVLIIVGLGSFARWLGLLLFAGFAMITLFDIFKLLIVGGTSTLPTVLRSRGALRTDAYRDIAAVAFVESMIIITYNFYLYGYFFK